MCGSLKDVNSFEGTVKHDFLSPLQLQLHMQEDEEEIEVSWRVSHLDTERLQLMPLFTQVYLKRSVIRHAHRERNAFQDQKQICFILQSLNSGPDWFKNEEPQKSLFREQFVTLVG